MSLSNVFAVKKTRKKHYCIWCNEVIEIGSTCTAFSGKGEDGMFRVLMHDECKAAMDRDEDYDSWEPFEPGECLRGKTYSESDEIKRKRGEEK